MEHPNPLPKNKHDAIVDFDEERREVCIFLQDPLKDFVKGERVDYPLRSDALIAPKIGAKAADFCYEVMKENYVAAVLVTAFRIDVRLAPALSEERTKTVADIIIGAIPSCFGWTDVFSLPEYREALKYGHLGHVPSQEPKPWAPKWRSCRLWRRRTSMLVNPIRGRCYYLDSEADFRGEYASNTNWNVDDSWEMYFVTEEEKHDVEMAEIALFREEKAAWHERLAQWQAFKDYIESY